MTTRGEMVSMQMSDGAEIGVYHVQPKGQRRGGLVLIQEIFGVTDHIKELCDGYADDGTYPFTADTGKSGVGMPYLELLQCESP